MYKRQIYSRAKKLHIQTDVPRVVMIVETDNSKDNNMLELTRAHFGTGSKDFITAVDESNVIVVKDLAESDSAKEIEKAAQSLEAYLQKECSKSIRISYGTVVQEIKEVSRSYKEAKMALDVGKIFFDERDIIAYSELGIGLSLIHIYWIIRLLSSRNSSWIPSIPIPIRVQASEENSAAQAAVM